MNFCLSHHTCARHVVPPPLHHDLHHSVDNDNQLSHQYFNVNKLEPAEAQISTLPHYSDPQLLLGRTENQMVYRNPYRANDFYFEEPNTVKKPTVQHLERSFIN